MVQNIIYTAYGAHSKFHRNCQIHSLTFMRWQTFWASEGGLYKHIINMMLSSNGNFSRIHYGDVIMGAIASQITSLTIVYWTFYSDADERKHQSSASLAFVRGIHRGPVNSPHKWPVTLKMFPFDDIIMYWSFVRGLHRSPVVPFTKASNAELLCFLLFFSAPEHKIEQTIEMLMIRANYDVTGMIETIAIRPLYIHVGGVLHFIDMFQYHLEW